MAFAQFVQISTEQARFLKIFKKTIDGFRWYEHNAPRSQDDSHYGERLEEREKLAT